MLVKADVRHDRYGGHMTADFFDPKTSTGLTNAITLVQTYLRSDGDLVKPMMLAQSFSREEATYAIMALAHMNKSFLNYASDLAAEVQKSGYTIEGTPGGTTPETLLAEFERQVNSGE